MPLVRPAEHVLGALAGEDVLGALEEVVGVEKRWLVPVTVVAEQVNESDQLRRLTGAVV
jgi:hypothetical protein